MEQGTQRELNPGILSSQSRANNSKMEAKQTNSYFTPHPGRSIITKSLEELKKSIQSSTCCFRYRFCNIDSTNCLVAFSFYGFLFCILEVKVFRITTTFHCIFVFRFAFSLFRNKNCAFYQCFAKHLDPHYYYCCLIFFCHSYAFLARRWILIGLYSISILFLFALAFLLFEKNFSLVNTFVIFSVLIFLLYRFIIIKAFRNDVVRAEKRLVRLLQIFSRVISIP